MKRKNSGVTLIALIITIIVLLILAGVTIAMIVGDNGILNRAADAAVQTEQASIKEALDLAYSDYQLEFVNMYLEEGDSTRVASLDIVEVDRYAIIPAPAHGYFWYYLVEVKKCMNEDGLIDVESLVGSELSTGKGNIEDGTDIYLLTEIGDDYIVTYYDDNSNSEEVWRVSEYSTNTVEIKYPTEEEVAVEIEYVEGMTWDDWGYSKLYVDGFKTSGSSVDYTDSNGHTYRVGVKNDEGEVTPITIYDLITNENEYVLIILPA